MSRPRGWGQWPDIVVSDYRLAYGETGFDVITAVRRASGSELPAIVITGDTDPTLLRSMAERGILVLHKPLDLNMLQDCIELAVGSPAGRDGVRDAH